MGWRRWRSSSTHVEPVLGTVLELQLRSRGRATAARSQQLLLAELDRISTVFSVFDPHSELSRWRRGELDGMALSSELCRLLRVGLHWQQRGDGIFNPAVGVLTQRWKQAEREGVVPDAAALQALAVTIHEPRYRVAGEPSTVVERLGDCSALNFNALAKGMAVDIAVDRLRSDGHNGRRIERVVVNVGGDLLHSGAGALRVGIENPLRAYDNEPPLTTVEIVRQGLATSGSARRGVRIGDQWFSHVIDPRTGWPVDTIASASVFAADAATADVVATLVSVLPPADGLALVDRITTDPAAQVAGPIGCCIVDRHGMIATNAAWDAQVPRPTS